MFIPVTKVPDDFAEHLSEYNDILSKPQQHHFQTYTVGLVTCENKRTMTNINATRLPEERKGDSSLNRFFSEYKWSEDHGMFTSYLTL